jgi:SHS2 domain-containing protein
MSYRYLDDIAIADVAFEAVGKTREELFVAAGDALTNVMVEDLKSIKPSEHRDLHIKAVNLERLLFEYLQTIIFYKDAEQLLMRIPKISIMQGDSSLVLEAQAIGEKISPKRHGLLADVKAVTLHRFRVMQTPRGWKATVVLDI